MSENTGPGRGKPVECWLTDMDGVLVHEEQALPGGADFIRRC
jgi:NagD protein